MSQERVYEDPEFLKSKSEAIDVTLLLDGDTVTYLVPEPPTFTSTGTVKGDNSYKEGVFVHGVDPETGKGWRQYVSMFQIIEVIRNGEVFYSNLPGKGEVFKSYESAQA